MDESQRAEYNPRDYAYFPATYLDNPVYARDENFLKVLNSYPAAIRDALKFGKWGLAGGYFAGAWDPDANEYDVGEFSPEAWNKRWISTNWGFEHLAITHWHYMDDKGVIRTYREVVVKHQAPEMLAETVVRNSNDADGSMPKFKGYFLSHDAFASKRTATMGQNANSVAMRMTPVLRAAGLPTPTPSTMDKLGREQLMYELLAKRVQVGELYDDELGKSIPIQYPGWQIAKCCEMLIARIPTAARQEIDRELIEDTNTGDPLQAAGYGLYGILGRPGAKPKSVQMEEQLKEIKDPIQRHITHMKLEAQWAKKHRPAVRAGDWRRRMEGQ
jgi:hypothetical protein